MIRRVLGLVADYLLAALLLGAGVACFVAAGAGVTCC